MSHNTASSYQDPSSRKKKYGLVVVLFITTLLVIFGAMFIIGLLDGDDTYTLLGSEESREDSETTIHKQPEEISETTPQDGIIGKIIFVDVPETTFLHLRSDPGSNYSSLDQFNRGTILYVVGETIDSDGDLWLNVLTLNVIEGWVHSNYVTDNPSIIKSDDISDERQEELKAKKDKDFYNDFVLNHLGWSK